MSLAQVHSRACVGVEAPPVTVEVHTAGGLPKMSIVGLPETAVREARDRVKAALTNSGFDRPDGRVTISLAPAELPKVGGGFDLPIALGILAAMRQVPRRRLADAEFLGELSLAGELRPVRGALPATMRAVQAGRTIVLPRDNAPEASLLSEGARLTAGNLTAVAAWLRSGGGLEEVGPVPASEPHDGADLGDVVGQAQARRALEIAAAGGHNLLLIGPPGTGKTMLAARLPGILPPMTDAEALETAALHSVSAFRLDIRRWRRRPFRAPHHTCSGIALVGGGSDPRPGEISLAHNGVLFLDELPEFHRHVLEVLREPLESGRILISRAARQAEFPARFQLVCAMNPCPCGYAGDPDGTCHCAPDQITRYRSRISGPLLDRIDLQVEVPRPRKALLHGDAGGEDSATVRNRVLAARERQFRRQGVSNASLPPGRLDQECRLGAAERELLEAAADRLKLSPRGCHRVLRVARTAADLEGEAVIGLPHLAEAIALRRPLQPAAIAA